MYLVSSCLAGICSKYNGKSNANNYVINLVNKGQAIPLCAEQLGGLLTPRIPSERIGEKVITKDGKDVTENYILGAKRIVAICKILNINKAILKAKSPSCGVGSIYDGTFTGTLTQGNGVLADLLITNGIEVITENDLI